MDIRKLAFHFFKGMVRTVAGSGVAGVCCLAVLAFCRVVKDTGYMAVVDFVGAVAMLAVSVAGVYWIGGGRK